MYSCITEYASGSNSTTQITTCDFGTSGTSGTSFPPSLSDINAGNLTDIILYNMHPSVGYLEPQLASYPQIMQFILPVVSH